MRSATALLVVVPSRDVVRVAGYEAPSPGDEVSSAPGGHLALSLDALDAVSGGIAAPAGGSVRSTTSSYRWWGMTYQQTTHEALDADGNVVGTEVHRPGTVWSDTTETTANGTRTTYDVGGNGLGAQITTQHDANGRFQGAGFDGRANVTVGDFNLTGNLRGNVSVGRDENGNVTSAGADFHGDAGVTHEPSGVGLRAGIDASISGRLERDGDGNVTGAGGRFDANVPLDVTYNGERVVGVNFAGIHAAASGRATENGFSGEVSGSMTRLGQTLAGDAYVRTHGDQTDFGAHGSFQRQLVGPYGAQFRVEAGVDGSVGGDNPHITGTAEARASVFGQEIAGARGTATWDGDGVRAEGGFRHIDPADIPNIPLPNLPNVSLPELRLPELRLPDHLPIPDVRSNPTGLPGNPAPQAATAAEASLYSPQEASPSSPWDAEAPAPTAGDDPNGALAPSPPANDSSGADAPPDAPAPEATPEPAAEPEPAIEPEPEPVAEPEPTVEPEPAAEPEAAE